jgi:large conductance mechanosensitive channel
VLKDFKAFVLRGNVVDLAVGIVIGAAFGTVVKALVTDLITPLISIPGQGGLRESLVQPEPRRLSLRGLHERADRVPGDRRGGLLLRGAADRVAEPPRARRSGDTAPETKDCPECLSTIPYRAHRCAYCTAELPDVDAAA